MAFKRTRYGGGWEYEIVQSQKCSRECVNPNSKWIQCDTCDEWNHVTCIGLTNEKAEALREYHCRQCKKGRKAVTEKGPDQRVKESRPSTNRPSEPERAKRTESPPDSPKASDSDGSVSEPEHRSTPKVPTGKQRCPCGKSRPLEPYVKCYECNQVYHAVCVKVDPRTFPFICIDCKTREAKFQDKLLGEETFRFGKDDFSVYHGSDTEGNREEIPLIVVPASATRKSVLRKTDGGGQREKPRDSDEQDIEKESLLNARFSRKDDEAERRRPRKTVAEMLLSRSELEERLNRIEEEVLDGTYRCESRAKETAGKNGGDSAQTEAGATRSKTESAARAPDFGGKKATARVPRREETKRVGTDLRDERSKSPAKVIQSSNRRPGRVLSFRPLLKEFEEVVLDNRMEETEERLRDLAYEFQEVEARAKSLARERERLRISRERQTRLYRESKEACFAADSDDGYSDRDYHRVSRVPCRASKYSSRPMHSPDADVSRYRASRRMPEPGETVAKDVSKLSIKPNGKGESRSKDADPSMEIGKAVLTLAEQMAQLHTSNRYATGLTTLKVLTGSEGPEGVRRYFRQFELLTRDWTEDEKLDALSVKVEGKAQLVLSSMPPRLQASYVAVKDELLERLANEEPKRSRTLSDLMSGKPRKINESIADFGERVMQLVRNACDADCPASQIDEFCKAYFVTWVNDRELIPSLTEKRDTMEFRKLVDHAAALRPNLDQYKQMAQNVTGQSAPAAQQAPYAARAGLPQQPQRRDAAPQPRRDAPANFNPNRMPLRYTGPFPPAKNNFVAPRAPAATAAAEPAKVDETTVKSAEASAAGPEMMGYFDPYETHAVDSRRQRRRRNQRQGVRFCEETLQNETEFSATANTLTVLPTLENEEKSDKTIASPTVAVLSSDSKPAALGLTCMTVVRVRGMPCEALLDSGSRICLLEAGFLKGLILKSGAKLEDVPLRKSSVASISCANRSTLSSPAAVTLEVSYGGHCVLVEFQVVTKTLAFPLILGTNCLSDLGFQLINSYTGRDYLLSGEGEDEDKGTSVPTVDVCATATTIIPPFSQSMVPARVCMPEEDICCVMPRLESVVSGEQVVKIQDGEVSFLLANDSASPITIGENQVVGTADPVAEIFTSSDIIATDVLEELIAQWNPPAFSASVMTTDPKRVPTDPRERLRVLIELIGGPEVELSAQQVAELYALVEEFLSVFALSDSELGQTSLWTHKIELIDKTPVRLPERPLPYALREKVAAMIRDYLERKVISPSNSSYSSPVVLVRKRGDDQLRFCVDYRALNSRTSKFAGPLPNIDYVLLTMGPKNYFTSLDMLSAYWQICLDEESKPYTAFPALGSLYHFNVLSFGLTNAPGTFQQFMQRVFDGIVNDYVYIFLDDLLVVSSTWEEHIAHLREVFTRLRDAQLKLKPKKCRLAAALVKFLGHILSPEGLKMDPDKVAPMSQFPRPKCVRDVQSFRGLVGHYRKFIKGFALICRPLDTLTKKSVEFKWTDECEAAFKELKRLVCEEVTLQFPDFKAAKEDPARPLVVQTDACKEGVAGILCQKDDRGALQPIHFVSRTTKQAEKNYGITELEALSVKYCFTKLAPYLIGLPVVVETDHSALVSMFTKTKECGNSRIDKWAMQLMSRFDFRVVYKPGKSNVAADALSRSVAVQGIVVVAVTTRRMAKDNARREQQSVLPPISEAAESLGEGEALLKQNGLEDSSFLEPRGKMDWNECLVTCEFADVYKFLSERELPKCPETLQAVMQKAGKFALVEGKLHFVEPETAELRLFVPEPFRRRLFDERHSGIFAAHACGSKIYKMLRKQYWWPAMRSDCEKFARACQVCAYTRKPRNNVPPLQPFVSSAPWELLCIDLLQLPLAESGHKYALICVDHFTKYVVTCPLFDKTAESVADALVRKVFLVYGPCQRIHSDMGGEICNKIIFALTETFKMGQTTTAGYNPRCNGLTERTGRQLIKMLSQTTPIPQGWQERLEFVTFALNISPHHETGESGFFLMFARDARFPTEITDAMTFSPYAVDLDDFRSILMQNIGNAVQNVRAALDKSRERAKKYYDERNNSKADKYRVGQRVMVFDPSIPSTVANKLSWKYFGPFRILEISNNNARVLPVDKPLAEPQLVPLDRLCPIPVEVPPISYARKPNRSKILVASLTVLGRSLSVTTVELNVATVREEIPLHPYAESEEKDRFISKEKEVVLFTSFEANGLGPFYECSGLGKCSANCSEVLLSDVVPALPDSSRKTAKVPTLGHQIYLAALSRRYDGSDLEEKVKAVLKCPAAGLAKSIGSICAGAEVPQITHEIILGQARIRHQRCDRVGAALIQSGGLPLKMVGATAADHPLFSELTFANSRLIHAGVGDNLMGDVWEDVRHGAGKPLVTGPFLALVPPGDKALVRGQHVTVEETADLLAANFYLQQHAFSGAAQLIILVMPPTTPQCSARLDALLAVVRSFGHVQLLVVPPPPSLEPSYRAVVLKLLAAPDQQHLRATELGRSVFEIGLFGRLPDRRLVDVKSGKWSDSGRALLRQHLLEVSALRPLKFYQRPGPPPPPQPTVRSQVFKAAPPQQSRKRQFQPEPPKAHYYAKQTRKQ